MTDKIDHAALLRQYVHLIRSRFRSDQLDEFSGICVEDRVEIRRIAGARQGPTGPLVERIGGNPNRSPFTELNNLSPEAEAAWRGSR
jgi:hypothetical protein